MSDAPHPGTVDPAPDASRAGAGPDAASRAPAPTVHWPLGRPGTTGPGTTGPGIGGLRAAGPGIRRPGQTGAPASSEPGHGADGQPLRAVALRYDPFSGPPRVVASGRGHVAEALLARAREAGVPIEAQPDLVEVLMTLRIDQVIPPALYVAVAQVLAWAYLVDERVGRQRPGIGAERR